MKINLAHFKYKGKDDKFATLAHKDGHTMKVALNALSRPNRKAIESMHQAMMADGGEVSDNDIIKSKKETDDYNAIHDMEPKAYSQEVEAKMQKTDITPKQKLAGGGDVSERPMPNDSEYTMPEDNNIRPLPDDSEYTPPEAPQAANAQMASQQAPEAAPQAQQPTAAPPAQATAPQAPSDAPKAPEQVPNPGALEGYQSQVAGINAASKAEADMANAKAQALTTDISAQQQVYNNYQSAHDATNKELQAVRTDIANSHIDPNHYMGSMDTLGRISTAIGLALGGVGARGGHNQVLDFVNNQIDRDIQAQKAELGKKENIYSGILEQSKNEQQATNMTRLVMNDLTLAKLQKAEATAQNPLVKARAQQAIGVLQQQMGPLIQQQAMYKMINQPSSSNGQSALTDQDPATFVPFAMGTPEMKQKALEEINKIKEAKSLQTGLEQSAKDLQSKLLGGTFSPNDRASALSSFAGPFAKMMEGRFNLEESKLQMDALLPARTDSKQTLKNKEQRREQIFKGPLGNNSNIRAIGLPVEKFKALASEPAQQYKTVGGIKYMRGPNGEAVKVQ